MFKLINRKSSILFFSNSNFANLNIFAILTFVFLGTTFFQAANAGSNQNCPQFEGLNYSSLDTFNSKFSLKMLVPEIALALTEKSNTVRNLKLNKISDDIQCYRLNLMKQISTPQAIKAANERAANLNDSNYKTIDSSNDTEQILLTMISRSEAYVSVFEKLLYSKYEKYLSINERCENFRVSFLMFVMEYTAKNAKPNSSEKVQNELGGSEPEGSGANKNDRNNKDPVDDEFMIGSKYKLPRSKFIEQQKPLLESACFDKHSEEHKKFYKLLGLSL